MALFRSGPDVARPAFALQKGPRCPAPARSGHGSRHAAVVERRAHRLLAERRMEGEWFDVSAEVACAAVCVAMAVDLYKSKAEATARR